MLTIARAVAEPAATDDFMRRVGPQLAVERRLAPNNQSVQAVTSRLFEAHWFVTPVVHAPAAGRIASLAVSAGVVVLTLLALGRGRGAEGSMAHVGQMSLMLAATLVVSPIVWDHYYVLLLLPAAALYRSDDRTIRTLLLAGAALLLSHRYWPLLFAAKSPAFMSQGLAGVMVLWIALLKLLIYDRVCDATPSALAVRSSAI